MHRAPHGRQDVVLHGAHQLVVSITGSPLDGSPVLDPASINAVVAASTCGYPAATGNEIGRRAWGTGTSVLVADSTLT